MVHKFLIRYKSIGCNILSKGTIYYKHYYGNKLDERSKSSRNTQSIDEKYTGVIIRKGKSRYVVRDMDGSILLNTVDHKKVEDFLYKLI